MCGIYGTTIKYSETQVREKLQRTAFRGPDQMGVKCIDNSNHSVFLGHNRLSIIDLDPRSNQPFTYYNHIHLVFNGEIYNFKTIKSVLIDKGYLFTTTSDTEVLSAAYLEYGEDCVNHFTGMFAFVIYDEKKQQLFGARDRLGKKPFYYYIKNNEFEFSSQISSIQLHHNSLSISEKAIAYYLAWGAIPEPQSIFNEIKKLLPGHKFTFNLNTSEFKTTPYWDINYKSQPQFTGTYEEAKTELSSILKETVSTRLFADVPVGVFLSGGIDSSIISAFAAKNSSSKIKTFAVKFNEKGFDESKYAKQVADHLETDHNVIECNYEEGIDLIDNFSTFYDEPFADPSAIPSLLLAKHTKKHVTVALSGDGGDEGFIGYPRYHWMKKNNFINYIPFALRKLGASSLELTTNYKLNTIAKAITLKDANQFYMASMTGIDTSYIKTNIDYLNVPEKIYLEDSDKNLYERISDFDIKTYLNWHINTKVDRATMAYAVEARAPLLDHRIIEFAQSLPTDFKYKGNIQKRILKDVLYDHVPKHIFDRPKAGFAMPFSEWFRKDLKDYVLSELDDKSLSEIPCIDKEKVQFMIKQHMDGVWNRYPLIWKLLVLKQWLKNNKSGLIIH